MKARKISLHIFFGIIAVSLFFSFYFFLKKPQRISPPKMEEEERRIVVLKDANYVSERDGRQDMRIRAKLARKYIDSSEIEMEEVEGSYTSEKKGSISFRGEKGIVNMEKQKGIVYGLQAQIKDKYEIRTPSLSFDLKKHSASGEDTVSIKGENVRITGTGIRGELKEGRFSLLKNVSGSIKIKGKELRFLCDAFLYDSVKEIYALQGNVKATGKDMYVDCEKMYLYGSEGEIKRVEAYRVGEMVLKGTVAKSERAVYDFSKNKVIFTGRVQVKKEDMELKGDYVEYDLEREILSGSNPEMKIIRKGS